MKFKTKPLATLIAERNEHEAHGKRLAHSAVRLLDSDNYKSEDVITYLRAAASELQLAQRRRESIARASRGST